MKDLKFEEALVQLEEVVRQLENGDLPLDESLKLFELGVALARVCSKKLDDAEGKIQQLISEDGKRAEFSPEEAL